jgi:hypothetical protein
MTTKKEETARLDDVLEQIDLITDGIQTFKTAEDFDAYVTEQMKTADGEALEPKKARILALKEAIATAKQFFAEGQPAKVKIYVDPFITTPETKSVDSPANLSPSTGISLNSDNIVKSQGIKAVRALASLAKELSNPTSRLRSEVAKELKVDVAKGVAIDTLAKVCMMFGIPADEAMECASWKVGDAIWSLQQAAKMEQLVEAVSGLATPAAPVEAAESDAEKTATTKSYQWPMDLNARYFDPIKKQFVEEPKSWSRTSRG